MQTSSGIHIHNQGLVVYFLKGCFMILSMMPKILVDLYPSYFIYQFFCYSKGFTTYYILD